ncbi:MAG TPA: tetratricopeptide repeat protein [Gemmatimonadales bacterium]|nr:tetratricopeptide repeat protein [Gemmatimonadales bacterium]
MAYQSEIEKLEQRYRENPQQWFAALADSYRKAGSIELALDVVRAGLQQRPTYVSGHIVHGRCLIDQHNDAEALRVFERVLELDRENVIAIKVLAEIGERTGQVDVARRWVSRLLEVDPANEEAQEMMQRLGAVPAAEAGPAVAAPAGSPEADTALSAAGALLADTTAPEPPAPVAETAGAVSAAPVTEPAPALPADEPGPATGAPRPAQAAEEEFVIERHEEIELSTGASSSPTVEVEPVTLERAEPALAGEQVEHQPAGTAEGLEPAEMTGAAASGESLQPPPDVLPFDDALAWGTGERLSKQISAADIEAAEHAHEASLDEAVHALPGLESAEVPPADSPTPVAPIEGVAPIMEAIPAAESREEPGQALPLIFPDESPPPAPAQAPVTADVGAGTYATGLAMPEPEPVVTETMAELYAQQGLLDEARDTYEKLLDQRPGDAGLQARLAALESTGRGAPSPARRTLVAAETGGTSVRDFLAGVFGGVAPVSAAPPSGPLPPPHAVAARPSPEAPSQPTVMEAAFENAEPPPSGEPTRRASDDLSLAAVFGEEPSPTRAPSPPASSKQSGAGEKSFSFDEFFGTNRPSRESAPAGDDDDFKRWLKSLKS